MNDKTETLVQALIAADNAKRDELVPASAMEYGLAGFNFNGKPVQTTDTAVRQLCASCGIPLDFFVKKMNEDERTSIFNRLNLEQGEAERLFRFHDDTLYGVVSPRYKKIDNVKIIDILQAATDSGIGLKPVRWKLDHDHTRVTLVPERASVGELTPSINITNSECGLASLSLWAGVYRWVCKNGMMVPISDITKSRWMHMGNSDITLPDIRIVLNRSKEYMERLYESGNRYLNAEDKEKIITDIADALGNKVAEKVSETANEEYNGAPTLYLAINSITRAAQSFRPALQSEVERYASTLLKAA